MNTDTSKHTSTSNFIQGDVIKYNGAEYKIASVSASTYWASYNKAGSGIFKLHRTHVDETATLVIEAMKANIEDAERKYHAALIVYALTVGVEVTESNTRKWRQQAWQDALRNVSNNAGARYIVALMTDLGQMNKMAAQRKRANTVKGKQSKQSK